MKNFESLEDLIKDSKIIFKRRHSDYSRIIIGYGTCGIATGAEEVYKEIEKSLNELKHENIVLEKTGCIGCCSEEVMVDIEVANQPRVSYKKVNSKIVSSLIKKHFNNEPDSKRIFGIFFEQPNILFPEDTLKPKDQSIFAEFPSIYDDPSFSKQQRVVLRNIGLINPENFSDYLACGGYQGLLRCLRSMTRDQVVNEIIESKLRGRGGAGFPTGIKWQFASKTDSKTKYVICNADEGDPGAFMDRALIEGDPHSVLEGMLICGYAIGASKGYIYIRAEYPLAIKRLEIALSHLDKYGLLGDNILGTDFNFTIEIRKGAGAFVCGEETALMASIMGKRGEPRPRPPYPAISGLWGKPTNINNVKTLVTIPVIIIKGADWFRNIGTDDTSGTAVFSLAGEINNSGLIEVPMGTTLREIIFDIGGGINNNKQFRAVQTGGPSGGCLPESCLDIPIDFSSMEKAGSIMGSGGMIVCSEDTCIVDLARYFLAFTQHESCGKCIPCREGTLRALEILERITEGKATSNDLIDLEELVLVIKDTSLCGLGQTAPNPVLSTLKYFKEEYTEHIKERFCRAGVCKALFHYEIDLANCTNCGACFKICPTEAIIITKEQKYVIQEELCTICGSCVQVCKPNAIKTVRNHE
ncbi:MAG: NADH-ubiquinone oxidoreductase-F iron-sulfur binding region domain-containing protein [Candidatus Hodarchaeales archaeon]|jgi:NADH:ubiquinone oxidoreductase subunit F (NADH-binding)/(2Fe-2S) ferredoxin